MRSFGGMRRLVAMVVAGAVLASVVLVLGAPAARADAAGPSAPGKPVLSLAGPDQPGSVNLTWSAPVSDGGSPIVEYSIETSTDGGSNWYWQWVPADQLSFGFGCGTPAVTCVARVAALNEAGSWGPVSEVSDPATTQDVPVAPGTPVLSLAGSDQPGAVHVSWSAPVSDGGVPVTDYLVETSTDGGVSWYGQWVGPVSSFDFGCGTPAVTCVARVTAWNAVGMGPVSAVSNAVTTQDVPGVPTQPVQVLAGIASIGSVHVSWSAPVSDGGVPVTDYLVETSTDGGVSWYGQWVGPVSSFDFGCGTPAVTCVARVTAWNAVGMGPVSAVSNAVTTQDVPVAPGTPVLSLVGPDQPGAVHVSWSAPVSDGGVPVTDYLVETSTDGGVSWYGQWVGPVSSFDFGCGTPAVTCVARVTAWNPVGIGPVSAVSNPVTTQDVPGAPGKPVVTVATPFDGNVTISWAAPASDGGNPIQGYYLETSSDGGTSWYWHTTGLDRSVVVNCGSPDATCTARVTAYNAVGWGSVSPISKTVALDGGTLVAQFDASNVSGVPPLAVAFDGSGSAGPIAGYSWTFGDGATAVGPSANHTYSQPGLYTAVLRITDGTNTAYASRTINVYQSAVIQPVHADAGGDVRGVAGRAVTLDGTASTPSDTDATYSWSFGDGSVGNGASPSHVYATAGEYVATLTVHRGSENGTDTVAVRVDEAGGVRITVLADGQPYAGADVVVIGAGDTRFSGVTDDGGVAVLSGLPDGGSMAFVYAPGYAPANVALAVVGGEAEATVALATGEVGTAVLESRPMTPSEITAAGIDLNDPANQNVVEKTVQLTVNGSSSSAPVYVNSGGYSVGPACGADHWCNVPTSGGGQARVQVKRDTMIWIITVKASFLKEFFEVSLVVTNLAPAGFTLTEGHALLDVPGGLTLMATNGGAAAALTDVPDITGGSSSTTKWVVRGDDKGSYPLTAHYTGVLDPVGADITFDAGLAEPLRVWGADAVRFIIDAEDTAFRDHPYRFKVGIENISDATVFNLGVEVNATMDGLVRTPCSADPTSSTAALAPGATFFTSDFARISTIDGTLDLGESFTQHAGPESGGDFEIRTHSPKTTPDTAPGIRAVGAGSTINVSWDPVPDVTQYSVFTMTSRAASPVLAATVNGTSATVLAPLSSSPWILVCSGGNLEHPIVPVESELTLHADADPVGGGIWHLTATGSAADVAPVNWTVARLVNGEPGTTIATASGAVADVTVTGTGTYRATATVCATADPNSCLDDYVDFQIADDDGDGVPNGDDRCPSTPLGATVGPDGCSRTYQVLLDPHGSGLVTSKLIPRASVVCGPGGSGSPYRLEVTNPHGIWQSLDLAVSASISDIQPAGALTQAAVGLHLLPPESTVAWNVCFTGPSQEVRPKVSVTSDRAVLANGLGVIFNLGGIDVAEKLQTMASLQEQWADAATTMPNFDAAVKCLGKGAAGKQSQLACATPKLWKVLANAEELANVRAFLFDAITLVPVVGDLVSLIDEFAEALIQDPLLAISPFLKLVGNGTVDSTDVQAAMDKIELDETVANDAYATQSAAVGSKTAWLEIRQTQYAGLVAAEGAAKTAYDQCVAQRPKVVCSKTAWTQAKAAAAIAKKAVSTATSELKATQKLLAKAEVALDKVARIAHAARTVFGVVGLVVTLIEETEVISTQVALATSGASSGYVSFKSIRVSR